MVAEISEFHSKLGYAIKYLWPMFGLQILDRTYGPQLKGLDVFSVSSRFREGFLVLWAIGKKKSSILSSMYIVAIPIGFPTFYIYKFQRTNFRKN